MSVRVGRPEPLIAEVILDRPEALNAISTDLARRLAEVCEQVLEDNALSAVILTSSVAKAFCVGADLKERAGFSDHDLRRQRPIIEDAFGAVRNLPIPTIAAVEGYALGGGCELALSCDLIVASENAVFGLPEVGLGLIPGGGGTQLLPRRVGWNRAADLIFTGRRIDANGAYRIGLVDRLVAIGTARETAATLLIATHNAELARRADATLRLHNGLLEPA